MEWILWIAGIALILVGLAGVVIPVLPGALLVFVGMVVSAWADHFERIGWPMLIVLGLLAATSYLLDFVAGLIGVRRLGASNRAVWGAAIGTIIGLFFGLLGVLIGPFMGAVLGELTTRRPLGEVGRAGVGAWIGVFLGAALKVALVGIMIGLFVVALAF